MTFEEFTNEISENITDRFNVISTDKYCSIAPSQLNSKNIYEVQLLKSQAKGLKTILVTSINSFDDLKYPLKWAAAVKDVLLDPQSADLYLFIHQSGNLPLETCLRIESSEEFCRKFILRPDEATVGLIDRTFLSILIDDSSEEISNSPTLNAFNAMRNANEWMDEKEQKKWQELLLSDMESYDIIQSIFMLKKDDYEISQ
jgi:hypothetical protein